MTGWDFVEVFPTAAWVWPNAAVAVNKSSVAAKQTPKKCFTSHLLDTLPKEAWPFQLLPFRGPFCPPFALYAGTVATERNQHILEDM